MKEQLLKLLNLKPEATDEQVVEVVADLIRQNDQLAAKKEELEGSLAEKPETGVQKLEKRIAQKIAQSGGALNREQALVAIQHQDEAAAKAKPAKKK